MVTLKQKKINNVTKFILKSSKNVMTLTNDQFYINQVLNGNIHSFSIIIDKYKDLVFTLTFKMLKNREEAEEVSQDIFIKIFNTLDRFKGDAKFSTWIYKIAYNACLDLLKKKNHLLKPIYLEDFNGNDISNLENILEEIGENEKKLKFQKCLNMLDSEDSFLLTLYYFEEQSIDEIATIFSTNINNIKVRLYRSRKRLGTILTKQFDAELINYYEKNGR